MRVITRRFGAWWANPWRQPAVLADGHVGVRVWVARAGADRDPVLVQRRTVPQHVAGLLDALVVGRPDQRSLWHDPALRQRDAQQPRLAVLTMLIATPLGVAPRARAGALAGPHRAAVEPAAC